MLGAKGAGGVRRSLPLVALLGALAVALVAAATWWAGGPEPAGPVKGSGAATGFSAALTDEVRPARGGRVAYTTRWELRWRPVPAARDYLVTLGTPEGLGTSPRVVSEPRFGLSVASGESPPAQQVKDRDAQLAAQAAQLSVAVAPRFANGKVGPRSAPMPVGERR